MLTGMLKPTEGYAVINGKNISSQMDTIREDLGICLQHDCLFPELTVIEHVRFFSRIKGVYQKETFEEAERSVETAIIDVALFEKRNTYSKDLSGGMKRKLSLAIAFCGGSKIVFLDEVSSGYTCRKLILRLHLKRLFIFLSANFRYGYIFSQIHLGSY